ncbi:MAG: alpha-hydroxy-acid oxidizing protein [Actinomycetota bacterium]|nr:alpha-hydroxy-acid oxidizing protein [Actinomycetota bacterium]
MDLDELEQQARAVMAPGAFDYYAGGAEDEITLVDNTTAWRRMRVRYRVLRDVSQVSTETTVLGTRLTAPVLVAPLAYQRLAHDEGEAATARGAGMAGSLMVVSTLATIALEEVAAAAPDAPRWFQLYVHKDRGWTAELVDRAVDAGYLAVMLTVDLPVLGHRRRDERNDFALPEGMEMANIGKAMPDVEGSGLARYATEEIDPSITFDDIGWFAERSGLPVVVKGIIRGDDAAAAIEAGATAVSVSNHGGRQLDTSLATADALREVVDAVAGQGEVYVDGGIRRGTDVVKAVALGARVVLLGRPVLWGLATGGSDGVRAVLDHFRSETARSLALCGAASVADLTPDLVG